MSLAYSRADSMVNGSSYRHSHTSAEKGQCYELEFRHSRWLQYVWGCERAVLDQVLSEQLQAGPVRLLDFACGTGRIINALADRVEAAVGVDVSQSMLAVAREAVPQATFYQVDMTREPTDLGGPFDLITAFRFFPNAEPELRTAAMQAMVEQLAPRGVLVFNNHQNASSTHFQLGRLLQRRWSSKSWTIEDMETLLEHAGLTLVAAHAIGVLPASSRRCLFPLWVHRQTDNVVRRFKYSTRMAQDIIFVCRKQRVA